MWGTPEISSGNQIFPILFPARIPVPVPVFIQVQDILFPHNFLVPAPLNPKSQSDWIPTEEESDVAHVFSSETCLLLWIGSTIFGSEFFVFFCRVCALPLDYC